jgi:predicted amidohydrolase YtcJ
MQNANERPESADLIVVGGKIATLDKRRRTVSALAASGGKFIAVGDTADVLRHKDERTLVIDAGGRTVIPGLNDSHLHVIRGGLHYNLELRWDGVASLADAMAMLKTQAQRTAPPQWVRVVGGWSEFQFKERRLPTLAEINEVSPDVPVFILHLYDRALLNAAALRAVDYTKNTPDPPGGIIERDKNGNPTGLLIAKPNALILYKTLSLGPKPGFDDQLNSTRHFMRELNRLGLTSIIDAGGGFQNYPDDYQVIDRLHRDGQMTLRIAYNLFTQNAGKELEDFTKWTGMTTPYAGDDFYRMNGAGEMLVFSAADFEDFLEPQPDLAATMEVQLETVVRNLAQHRWPFRLHATYDESISRFLNVFEKVNRDVPLNQARWLFDHAETISQRNIERVKALGGAIAIQHRMAYQGEYFVDRYGIEAGRTTPPIQRMLAEGIPVGAGTDGTRVASYNPWVCLYWLVTGKTVGGTSLYSEVNRLDRTAALRLCTSGSAWFSREEEKKGTIEPGQLADFAMLTQDYFSVAEEQIKGIESDLTVVGGKVVYGRGDFARLAPPLPPPSPDWSPVRKFGGYGAPGFTLRNNGNAPTMCATHGHETTGKLWGPDGCDCFVF